MSSMTRLLLLAALLSGCSTTSEICGVTPDGDEFCTISKKIL
jgi:hypothetical protein